MTYREKYSFIKKAAKLDIDTNIGYYEFLKAAKKSNLGEQRLSYYSNAYEAAGDSGLRALSYRKRMPEAMREVALEKINEYLYNKVSPQHRSEIGFLVKVQYNRITIAEK